MAVTHVSRYFRALFAKTLPSRYSVQLGLVYFLNVADIQTKPRIKFCLHRAMAYTIYCSVFEWVR